jgi:hypothetical protein
MRINEFKGSLHQKRIANKAAGQVLKTLLSRPKPEDLHVGAASIVPKPEAGQAHQAVLNLLTGFAPPFAEEAEDHRKRDRGGCQYSAVPDLPAREAEIVARHAGQNDRDIGRHPKRGRRRQEIDVLFHDLHPSIYGRDKTSLWIAMV